MNSQADKYSQFTLDTLGISVPLDLTQTKLHSVYPEDSEWHQQCVHALFEIERNYVQELINDIKCRNVLGAFVEFGIYQGHWIKRLFDMTERAELSDRNIWGFDSFKGLSQPHPAYDTSFWKEGMYAASRTEVEKNLNIAERPRIKLVEGFFSDSLKGQEAASLRDVAFARIDCDIYAPTVECLEFLSQRLAHGAVLMFDDWTHNIECGEAKAFAEWVSTVPHLRFEFLCLGPWDHLYLRVWHRERTPTEGDDQITNITQAVKEVATKPSETIEQLAALNQALKEKALAQQDRDSAHVTINEIFASTSWRVTAPLRRIKIWLREFWDKNHFS